RLPEVMAKVAEIGAKYELRIANLFHAGDGNLHPAVMYDGAKPGAARRVLEACGEILEYCVSLGGTVTGEHGVGIEKLHHMRAMFSPEDLAAMHRVRAAFVKEDRMNPFKTLPREGVEIDVMEPGRKAPQ